MESVKLRLSDPAYLALAAKKARAYCLQQCWYANPIEIESFFNRFSENLTHLANSFDNGTYRCLPILPCPVPKSIEYREKGPRNEDGWEFDKQSSRWARHKTRTLAHVAFQDQVVGAALVMLLGDRLEAISGDVSSATYPKLISFGNRLAVSRKDGNFPIGSSATYRFWGDDYSRFVQETSRIFNSHLSRLAAGRRLILLSGDVANFYPSVSFGLLEKTIATLYKSEFSDIEFLLGPIRELYSTVSQASDNAPELRGLPQGYIASGLLSNAVLNLHFDTLIRSRIESRSKNDSRVCGILRYVDDFRVIVDSKAVPGRPRNRIEDEPVFVACQEQLQQTQLKIQSSKTSCLEFEPGSSPLTEGKLAEHMERLHKRAYLPLLPIEAADLFDEFRLLFHSDVVGERQPPVGTIVRNSSPNKRAFIDGPGVRTDSRRRFCAGRSRGILYRYESEFPELFRERRLAIADELLITWKQDPSQVRLLFNYLILNGFSNVCVRRVVKHIKDYRKRFPSFGAWVPFINSTLFRLYLDAKRHRLERPKSVVSLAYESSSTWFETLLATQVIACVGRARYSQKSENPLQVLAQEYAEYLSRGTRPDSHQKIVLFTRISSIQSPPESLLIRRAQESLNKVTSFSQATEILQAFAPSLQRLKTPLKLSNQVSQMACRFLNVPCRYPSGALIKKRAVPKNSQTIAFRATAGEYRSEKAAIELMLRLLRSDFFRRTKEEIEKLTSAGRLHPFNFTDDGTSIVFVNDHSLPGWRNSIQSVPWLTQEKLSPPWAWPLGMTLIAALTGNSLRLLGGPPSARFSLYRNLQWLQAEGAYIGSGLLELLTRLLQWPGQAIAPFPDHTSVISALQTLRGDLVFNGSAQLVRISTLLDRKEGAPLNVVLSQSINRNPKMDEIGTPENRLEVLSCLRAISQRTATKLIPKPDIVVFPELAISRNSLFDIRRFVQTFQCIVLFGMAFYIDKATKRRNSLIWIIPSDDPSVKSPLILRQDKFHLSYPERDPSVAPPIIPADIPTVLQIHLSKLERLAALNCFEFTDGELVNLLRGRIESLFVPAHNKDVTSFDGFATTEAYNLYSFVSVINCGNYGGTTMMAPYKATYERKILGFSGNNHSLVGFTQISLKDFRQIPSTREIKSPPAGFRVR